MIRSPAIASLLLRLDRAAPATLQRQLADELARAIAEGVVAPGARLPPSRVLAAELAVSRNTAVAALRQLIDEGYLESRERSGIFVAARPPAVASVAGPRRAAGAPVRLSRRIEELAREAGARERQPVRPRAFRLSRPALEAFPVREWSRILSRRAARTSIGQLDYGQESPELRAAIADLASTARGMRIRAEQVLLFGGGQRALDFAVAAVVEPGDRAWMEEPGYPGARRVLASAGARIAFVPVDEDGLDVAAGERLAGDARVVYTTPSCQFPLGVTLSPARRQALLRFAERAGACVIEDDYDAEFRHYGPPLAALHGLDPRRVLYIGSFSRTMFPALRLGYLVVPEALVDRLRAARATLEDPLPSLPQLALADFIAEGHFARHLRRMRVLYRRRVEALRKAAGGRRLRLRPTAAGLHVVADLAPGVDAAAVAAAAARRGVEVAPLADFCGAGGGAVPAALVLGFGDVSPERARDAVERLAEAIDEVAPTRGATAAPTRRSAKGSTRPE